MPSLLDRAVDVLRTQVAPRAAQLDHDPSALAEAMRAVGEAGLLALRRPNAFGGPEMAEEDFRTFQEEAARASGAFAFLQTQHQSAVSMISKGENDELMERVLPGMHDGSVGVGIGFSQLRRPGPPICRATPEGDGYRLDGHVPWVTGFGFYRQFLIGAQLPDGSSVFGLVPLHDAPGLKVNDPMRLAAMEAARTVTVDLDGYRLPAADIAFHKPARWIVKNDMINIALQGHFALGCARAGLDVLAGVAEKKGNPVVCRVHESLAAELTDCRATLIAAQRSVSEETTEERLRARAGAIELMGRCAHAAVAASAGAANVPDHPANRVWREAVVFTVSAQTQPVMEATLARLVGRG